MSYLPEKIKADTNPAFGTRPFLPVAGFSLSDVPERDWEFDARWGRRGWDGHTTSTAARHLASWNMPDSVREIARRTEDSLAEGIPDVKRRALRNQDSGMLQDDAITTIALGETLENGCWRWSRSARDDVRVAICLDSSCNCEQGPEVIASRIAVAMGLAAALQSLDYESTVVAGSSEGCEVRKDRYERMRALALVLKQWDAPIVDSGAAHFADTGFARLISSWSFFNEIKRIRPSKQVMAPLSDGEWRQLCEADVYIWIGPQHKWSSGASNPVMLRQDAPMGPEGPDVVRLGVSKQEDIEGAIETIQKFFEESYS